MNRALAVAVSIAAACVATLGPILVSVYVAREDAERREQRLLQNFTASAILRLEAVGSQVGESLTAMAEIEGGPCSEERLSQFRRVTFGDRYIQDAGMYRPGTVRCSAVLGNVEYRKLRLAAPDWRGKDGRETWFESQSAVIPERHDMVIGREGYFVSVDPRSFVDLVDVAQRDIVVIHTEAGRIVATTSDVDRRAMLAAWFAGGNVESAEWRYATANSTKVPLGVVIRTSTADAVSGWGRLLAVWLAGGVVVGGVLGWLVLQLLGRRLSLHAELKRAIQRRELEVWYQPVVALNTGRCVGAEALVRWRKGAELIPPDMFIAMAETHGLIPAITDFVLETVVIEMGARLRRRPDLYVSVNVSRDDLKFDRFIKVLEWRLAGTELKPEQIRIELTERSFMDAEATRRAVAAFREAGHPVYIDDFGTGYSSLSYLQNLKIDVLKIDKSFVDTINQDAASSVVAPHIIAMAHSLGVELVAEGIEHQAQAAYLIERGVQYGQGWLFARPMPVKDFLRYLDIRPAPTPSRTPAKAVGEPVGQ